MSRSSCANLNPAAEAEVEAALARGDETITVAVRVPVEFKQHIIDAVPVLIEADEYCRDGTLLTLATPDNLRAFGVRPGSFAEKVARKRGVMPRGLQVGGRTDERADERVVGGTSGCAFRFVERGRELACTCGVCARGTEW